MTDKKKMKYEKPVLKTMELKADETLATGCKTLGNTSGGYKAPCYNQILGKCSGSGS